MDSTETRIREYILSEVLTGEDPEALKNDTPLVSDGILDSLATLRLVSFLEEEFSIEVEPYETTPEYFDTVERISALVESKTKG